MSTGSPTQRITQLSFLPTPVIPYDVWVVVQRCDVDIKQTNASDTNGLWRVDGGGCKFPKIAIAVWWPHSSIRHLGDDLKGFSGATIFC